MFLINDDVVMQDLIGRVNYFGIVTAVDGEGEVTRYSVVDPVRMLAIVTDAAGKQIQVATPTNFYFIVRAPTEAESEMIFQQRLLAQLDIQWAEFRSRPPTIDQVRMLNDAIQALDLGQGK